MPNRLDHLAASALRGVGALLVAAVLAACGTSLTTDVPPEAEDPTVEADADSDTAASQLPEGHLQVPPEDVDTLFQSSASGVQESRRAVIRTGDDWVAAWTDLHAHVAPPPPVPDVDFDTHLVLLAAMGEKPSGGFRVAVDDLSHDADTLRVVVRETSPGAACVNTMALTHPAVAVQVPLVAENVSFVEESTVTDCS